MKNDDKTVRSNLWKTYGVILGVMIAGPILIFTAQKIFSEYFSSNTVATNANNSSPKKFESNKMTPDMAVINHYKLIQNRQLDKSWSDLSTSFQGSNLTKGFQEYTEWWNSVDTIDVGGVRTIDSTSNSAIVQADLKYHLRSGRLMSDQKKYIYLVWDNDKWLINGKSDTYNK
jgi:hypothetical protein